MRDKMRVRKDTEARPQRGTGRNVPRGKGQGAQRGERLEVGDGLGGIGAGRMRNGGRHPP